MSAHLERRPHLLDYWRVIRRRRWAVLSTFTLIVAGVAIYSFIARPIYRATAQIEIGSESLRILSFQEGLSVDTTNPQYYQTQYELLKSDTLLKKVIDRLKLDRRPEFSSMVQDLQGEDELTATRRNDRLVKAFRSLLTVAPIRQSRLVNIHFDSPSPHLAASAANTLVQSYIDWNLEMKATASENAVRWLTTQIEEQRKKAEEARAALEAFKQEKGLVMVNEESETIQSQRLSALNAEYLGAQTRRVEAETRFNQVSSLLEDPERLASVSEVIKDPLVQSLRAEEIKLAGTISDLSLKYGPKHPQIVRLKAELDSIHQKMGQEVKKIVISLRNDYEVAKAREATLLKALNRQKAESMDLAQKSVQYGVLKRETESAQQIYEVLLKRLKEASLEEDIKESNIRIVNPAPIPLSPYKPNKAKNLLLSLIVGAMMGIGLAFFFEYLDNTLKTPEDLKEHLDLPFLGMVPHLQPSSRSHSSKLSELLILHHSKSSAAESYHMVRTNLLLSSSEGPPQVLLVSSPAPKEGKTITAANLAIALAQAGSKTLLIDGDFRRPQIHTLFGLKENAGLVDYLTQGRPLESLIQSTPVSNLKVIASGPHPPNPAELLSSARLRDALQALRGQFQAIIFDSPPLAVVTDPVLLSQLADGTILVVQSGRTAREVAQMAKEQLLSVNATLLGVVLNDVEVNREGYYYHYYGRYYHHYYGA
jgi:exopolysaccharide transport family protein